jgi:hypothetical protein
MGLRGTFDIRKNQRTKISYKCTFTQCFKSGSARIRKFESFRLSDNLLRTRIGSGSGILTLSAQIHVGSPSGNYGAILKIRNLYLH